MSYALTRLTGDGSTTTYTIGFAYRDAADVIVKVDGVTKTVTTDYTFPTGGTQVTFGSAPADGAAILIQRATSQSTRLVDYAAGAVFKESDLDTDSTQGFYMAQEAIDIANDSITKNDSNLYDAEGVRVINVADPVAAQDAATKAFVQTVVGDFNSRYYGALATAPTSPTPSEGDLWYDSANDVMKVYANSGWQQATSAVATSSNRAVYTVGTVSGSYTGSSSTFPAVYDSGFVDVFLNGAKLIVGTDFQATNGSFVYLTPAASSGDKVDIVAYGAAALANINTVADDIANINTVATNISAVQGAAGNASTATTKAAEASASATAASNSASTASGWASTAGTKATEAAASATSASGASSSAATQASNASTSATNAATSATAASTSATSAATSASTATTKATEASNSATAAASSATTANTAATNATNTVNQVSADVATVAGISSEVTTVANSTYKAQVEAVADDLNGSNTIGTALTSANNAAASASTASTKASEAATSASTATSQASTATAQASSASGHASTAASEKAAAVTAKNAAETAASNASSSESNAANSASAAASSYSAANSSASNAASSATNAAASATEIKSITAATGAAGSSASYDSGSGVLSVPRGDTGATGPTGPQGPQGDQGAAGPAGASATAAGSLVYGGATKLQANSTGIDVTGEITSDGIALGDNDKATFGASDDLQIYHNGNNSFIEDSGTGSLYVRASSDFRVQSHSDNKDMIRATSSGAVTLYNNNAQKLATTSTGIAVTGTTYSTALDTTTAVVRGSLTTLGTTYAAAINSTGINVTGTATMDGLTVSGSVAAGAVVATILNSGANGAAQLYLNNDAQNWIVNTRVDDAFSIYNATSNKTPFLIATNGDISFYEDTGTTPKLFWDASAESLGIGTSNPRAALDFGSDYYSGTPSTLEQLINKVALFTDGSGPKYGLGISDGALNITAGANGDIRLHTNGANERMRIDSSGNVGIGITPSTNWSSNNVLQIGTKASFSGSSSFSGFATNLVATSSGWATKYTRAGAASAYLQATSDGSHRFYTAPVGSEGASASIAERMRIDSSGNLLVGKTSGPNYNVVGVDITTLGEGQFTVNNGDVLQLNRKSSDGTIVNFRKDGTTVGSIGSLSNHLHIGNGDTALRFIDSLKAICPLALSISSDAVLDLGRTAERFKDLYLSGGVHLGGTGAANKLDDYESGTFTATLKGTVSEPATLITTTATYTKVGRNVTYNVSFENVNTTGYSGIVSVAGFPFTNNHGRTTATTAVYSLADWTDNIVGVMAGSTTMELLDIKSGLPWTGATHNAGATRYLWLSGTYMTDA